MEEWDDTPSVMDGSKTTGAVENGRE